MVSITLDTIIKGGEVVTREGVQKLSIGVKDGKIAVLGPDEALVGECVRPVLEGKGQELE